MTIRDLIEQLEDVARRGGDRLHVSVMMTVDRESDFGDGYVSVDEKADVCDAVYFGGSEVVLRT